MSVSRRNTARYGLFSGELSIYKTRGEDLRFVIGLVLLVIKLVYEARKKGF